MKSWREKWMKRVVWKLNLRFVERCSPCFWKWWLLYVRMYVIIIVRSSDIGLLLKHTQATLHTCMTLVRICAYMYIHNYVCIDVFWQLVKDVLGLRKSFAAHFIVFCISTYNYSVKISLTSTSMYIHVILHVYLVHVDLAPCIVLIHHTIMLVYAMPS